MNRRPPRSTPVPYPSPIPDPSPNPKTVDGSGCDPRRPQHDFAGLRPEERSLVIGLVAGDPAAFERLDREFRDRIRRFAVKRLRDPVEADDVCQDVFLDIHRSIGSFEGRSSLLTWIFGIAHHQVHRRFRRRDRDTIALEADAIERLVPDSDRVEERIDAARVLDHMGDALERDVAPRHRVIFDLRYRDGQATGEIARQLGRSTQSVKISLFRTRRTLLASVPRIVDLLSA